MDNAIILWADDEIELLKPHILFLKDKGYQVDTANNGADAIDLVTENDYDIVFLDENMPGLSGLETLVKIKNIKPSIPVVMITKSEEETIMEDAIGSKISDYLIKPVNPKQILLTIKKNLENKRLISEKTTSSYQQEFRNIGMQLSDRLDHKEWTDLYKKLIYWELELEKSQDSGMKEILQMQKSEANNMFSKFYERNYKGWLDSKDDNSPVLSHTLFQKTILPLVEQEKSAFVIVIDNFRYDQWKVLQPLIEQYYKIAEDQILYSILPTATQYARNALFSGLMPSEIQKKYPQYWMNDEDEGLKNLYEEQLFGELLKRLNKNIKFSYTKILSLSAGKKYVENINNLLNNKINILVYNFVDMLSHARTEMEVIRELANDESAYRSLTESWFVHSPLFDLIKQLASHKIPVIITTDHGTVNVDDPIKVIGDKNTNTNLRYKQGKNLNYNPKEVFEMRNPSDYYLPKQNVTSAYIFARKNSYFAYPNNYNHYVNYYKNTFQHGGLSIEEVLIPCIYLKAK
ncbi:MAG: bifunctional response regulator/alkaline phosphatase family protein [Bacteroidota bacterium]